MAKARRRQKFFDVNMPILNKETQLYAYNIKELEGRTITYDLTRTLRGKAMLLKLNVSVDVEGKEAKAKPIGISLMPYFLRRMMRKGTNYVEDSFQAKTKTHKVTIKPFLITRKKVSRAVQKELRVQARKELKTYLKKHTSEQVFEDLLKNTLQKSLSSKLKKTYPLSFCEIRVFNIEKPLEKEEKKTEKVKKKEE